MEKQRWEESERRRKEVRRSAKRKSAGQMRDEKLHAVVARSTFPSQNAQSTPFSDHFWKLRRRKSARRCGAKHISKSKCTKHTMLGPSRTTFGSCDVEKVHSVVARSTFPSQKCKKLTVSDHLGKWAGRNSARRCGAKRISKSKVSKTGRFLSLFLTFRGRKSAQ